jgi:hypothetical protein
MSRQENSPAGLSDFRADKRILLPAALALPAGIISAFVAKALLWLIDLLTNLAFFGRFSFSAVTPQQHHRAATRRIVGYLGRADILEARIRSHEEEELREKGPLLANLLKPSRSLNK